MRLPRAHGHPPCPRHSFADVNYINMGSGEWFWVDGSVVSYLDFYSNLPNAGDRYMGFQTDSNTCCGRWFMMDAGASAAYLCGPTRVSRVAGGA